MRKSLLMLGVSVAFLCATVPASAKRGKTSSNNNNNNNNNQNNQNSNRQAPSKDNSALSADSKKLDEDRKEITKAQEALNAVVAKLKATFDSTPDHQATVAGSQKAQADYEALRTKAIAAIRNTPAYKSAVEEREQLAAKSATDSGGDADANATLATAHLNANKKITQLETEAVKADPKAAEAQQQVSEWGAKLSAQNAEFQKSIKDDADWQAAKDALDKAKAQEVADEKQFHTNQASQRGA